MLHASFRPLLPVNRVVEMQPGRQWQLADSFAIGANQPDMPSRPHQTDWHFSAPEHALSNLSYLNLLGEGIPGPVPLLAMTLYLNPKLSL